MAATPKRLFTPTQLTGSNATYYTAGTSVTTVIKKLTLTNSTATPEDVTVYLVPNGFVAGSDNILLSAQEVGDNVCREVTEAEGHVLNPGDRIQAFCSTGAAVNIMASGVEFT